MPSSHPTTGKFAENRDLAIVGAVVVQAGQLGAAPHTRAVGEPAEGRDWNPATSGNTVHWDGEAVVKSYGTNIDGWTTERQVLRFLENRQLPVPVLDECDTPGELRMPYISGVDGRTVGEGAGAGQLLADMGAFLRRLHAIDASPLRGFVPGDGSVIVHGDFAVYNALASPQGRLVAILDWEEVHLGDVAEDLGWCEWQFQCAHPGHSWAIPNLIEGYGPAPSKAEREEAATRRLAELTARSRNGRG